MKDKNCFLLALFCYLDSPNSLKEVPVTLGVCFRSYAVIMLNKAVELIILLSRISCLSPSNPFPVEDRNILFLLEYMPYKK